MGGGGWLAPISLFLSPTRFESIPRTLGIVFVITLLELDLNGGGAAVCITNYREDLVVDCFTNELTLRRGSQTSARSSQARVVVHRT